jgi:hypothetical protein
MSSEGSPAEPSVGADLRRVLPVASDDLGGGFRIVSVELYAAGLVVRWLASPPKDRWSPHSPLVICDDVGTGYQYIGGGSFGRADALWGDTMLVPAPPGEASALTIAHGDETVVVNLA